MSVIKWISSETGFSFQFLMHENCNKFYDRVLYNKTSKPSHVQTKICIQLTTKNMTHRILEKVEKVNKQDRV